MKPTNDSLCFGSCIAIFEKYSLSAIVIQPKVSPSTEYLKSAGSIYTFTLLFCTLTNLPVMLITLVPEWFSYQNAPLLISLSSSTVTSVYLPSLPFAIAPIASLTAGCLTFLQWDLHIAGTASLIWGVVLYRNACLERQIVAPTTSLPIYRELLSGERYSDRNVGLRLVFRIFFWTLTSGPFGALAVLLWERDAIVKQKIKQGI
jgi:hypothetical protein